MATLNDRRIHRAEVHVPRSGGWLADVTLDVGAAPAGVATLQIADLTFVGKILPGQAGLDAPDLPHVMIAGGSGWDVLVPEGKYSSGSSVRLTTVLRDLAALAGEPYDAPDEYRLPPAYEWTGSTATAPRRARDVLAELVVRRALVTWRVTPAGRTRFDPWPTLPEAKSICTVSSRDLARGLRRCALTTRAASLLPGATLDGDPIDRVIFSEEVGALTAEVYHEQVSAPTLRRMLRSLVLELFPWTARFGITSAGDLEIRSTDRNINLAGAGAELLAVHRVSDLGDGGTLSVSAPGTLQWTGPDGRIWVFTFTSAAAGAPVVIGGPISFQPDPGKITTKATTGSSRVRSA